MKKWAYLINGIAELAGGIILYFNGQNIFQNTSIILLKIYALSAASLGLLSLLLYGGYDKYKDDNRLYLVFMFFQAAVAMSCYAASPSELPLKLEACLFHLGLFVILFVAYMKDVK